MQEQTFFDHARNPRNVGLLEDANVVVQAGDPECDDKLIYFIRIEDDVFRDISFLIEGCETTVATSSMVTELVKGQRLDAIMNVGPAAITGALAGFPQEKLHCPAMAAAAMQSAVRQYRSTPRGEASSSLHDFDQFRVVAQVLNQPLSQVYSAVHDL